MTIPYVCAGQSVFIQATQNFGQFLFSRVYYKSRQSEIY